MNSLTFLVDWYQAALTWLPYSWYNKSGGCALQTPIRVRALLLYTGISPSHDDSHFSRQSSTAATKMHLLYNSIWSILFNTSQHPIENAVTDKIALRYQRQARRFGLINLSRRWVWDDIDMTIVSHNLSMWSRRCRASGSNMRSLGSQPLDPEGNKRLARRS